MHHRTHNQRMNQTDLFHNALMASGYQRPIASSQLNRLTSQALSACQPAAEQTGVSEMCLAGKPHQCLQWLAPVLRDLANAPGDRWLTLLNPPALVSHAWLRAADLDPRRILIVRSNNRLNDLQLCEELLHLGCSHTVVSWLSMDARVSDQLERAAQSGRCRSLNISMP